MCGVRNLGRASARRQLRVNSPLADRRGGAYFQGMSITAIIEKGVIKLPADIPWASGTVVRIEPLEEPLPALIDIFKEFDGMAGDLPGDLAANLDHYVHGHSHP